MVFSFSAIETGSLGQITGSEFIVQEKDEHDGDTTNYLIQITYSDGNVNGTTTLGNCLEFLTKLI